MSAAPVRQALIEKGLIYSPDHGQIDFTVPHFADFMRRKHPSKSLSDRGSVADVPAARKNRA
jgi:hypothetical protein